MSNELKEHAFQECDEIFREYHGILSNEVHRYYLKSEADKVIAELKAENERLRGESCKLTDGCLRLKQCRKEKANLADKLRQALGTDTLGICDHWVEEDN